MGGAKALNRIEATAEACVLLAITETGTCVSKR